MHGDYGPEDVIFYVTDEAQANELANTCLKGRFAYLYRVERIMTYEEYIEEEKKDDEEEKRMQEERKQHEIADLEKQQHEIKKKIEKMRAN